MEIRYFSSETGIVLKVYILVFDETGADVVHPAVQMQNLIVFPSILDDGCLSKVQNLFSDILLYKSIPKFFFVLNRLEFVLVEAINIPDVPNPVVNNAD